MKILRTMAAVLMAFALLVFSLYNWQPVELMLWHNLVLETKVPVLVVLAFLIGFLPLLLYHSSIKWSLKRRIKSLENSMKMSVAGQAREPMFPPAAPPPAPPSSLLIPASPPAAETAAMTGQEPGETTAPTPAPDRTA